MKVRLVLLFSALLLGGAIVQAAPLGTAISYQGRLDDTGSPAIGTYSFRFRLLGDAVGTTQIGPVVDMPSLSLAGGLLNAPLDFGSGAFNADARWLEISVKAGGPGAAGDYIKLNPQPLPPAGSSQFARLAGDVLNGAITGAKLAPLAITTTHINDGAITAPKLGPASITSGNVADNAITAAKIASGQVVKSLNVNGNILRDNVTLAAGANVTLTPSGNTVTISSSGTGGNGIWTALGGNTYYTGGRVGIGTANPGRLLQLGDAGVTGSEGLIRLASRSTTTGANRYWDVGVPTGVGDPGGKYYSFIIDDPQTGTEPEFTIRWDTGNVGIGTVDPREKLDVAGQIAWGANLLSVNQGGAIELGNSLGNGNTPFLDFHFGVGATQDSNVRLINDADGQLSLYGNFNLVDGDISMKAQGQIISRGRLHIQANESLYLNPFAGAGDVIVGGGGGAGNLHVGGSAFWGTSLLKSDQGGAIELGNSIGNGDSPYLDFHYGVGAAQDFNVRLINDADGRLTCSGNFSVCSLTIRGGCDLAEPFPMKEEQIDKGSVVVIDEEHPGRLKLSTRAYDTQVAGIISGANGINPGISLTQEGVLDQGQNVALTGRVYVKADASHGAIKPGDLLTTSDTPGHAMKVREHGKAQGAILGKAMSTLKDGTGLVLVLVTLQ